MKTLGMIGGMSPESTVLYYQIINREVNRRLGGNNSANIVMHSVNFAEIAALQAQGNWQQAGVLLADSAQKLAQMGAEGLVLATNTMHKVADVIQAAVAIPLLHVVDATAAAIHAQGLDKVGLLGTRFTMSDGFYTQRMRELGIATVLPNEAQQAEIHRVIFEELCCNRFTDTAKRYYQQVVEDLQAQGAQGVILGCTEIGLLLQAQDCALPVWDSAVIHALAAVEWILG